MTAIPRPSNADSRNSRADTRILPAGIEARSADTWTRGSLLDTWTETRADTWT